MKPLTLLPIPECIPGFSKLVILQQFSLHHFSRLQHQLPCPIMKVSSPFSHFQAPSTTCRVLSESTLPSSSPRFVSLVCFWQLFPQPFWRIPWASWAV